jgi:malonyl-CoA decarboxylase
MRDDRDSGDQTGAEAQPAASQAGNLLQMDFRCRVPEMDDLTVQERLRSWCQEALDGRGKLAGIGAIARVADAYGRMRPQERDAFFHMLWRDFSADGAEVDAAIEAYAARSGDREVARLILALNSPRLQLFRCFNTISESLRFLVRLRADLGDRLPTYPNLWILEFELRHLLESWFNPGFLQLRRITWESPAALLENIAASQAVHQFSDWQDLKRRLTLDRACFAFIHPAMPTDPIIFVEVALVQGIADNIQRLLAPAAPRPQAHEADTAIFYGITSAQRGLRGIPLGNLLIKQVAGRLRAEFPGLTTFATLSPVPRLRADFLDPLLQQNGGLEPYFTADEARRLLTSTGAATLEDAVGKALTGPRWFDHAADALRAGLLRVARDYLTGPQEHARAACRVAHFHASNGAMLARINWLADLSDKGLAQSAGIMVNYLYDMQKFAQHQSEYARAGQLPVGGEVLEL